MATTSMSAPEAQPRINPFGRIIGVFTSPKQTFASIAERPSWVAPLVADDRSGYVCGCDAEHQDELGGIHPAQGGGECRDLRSCPRNRKIRRVAGQVKFWANFSYGVGVVAVPISALIFALIYWGAFNLFRGAGLRFGQAFGITTHAFLPTAISSILALIILAVEELWGR